MLDIAEYLKNKNVIVVGPSNHIKYYGRLIDSYDVVIRLNMGYPVPEAIQIDYGCRTDILFTSTGVVQHFLSEKNNTLPKFIVCVNPKNSLLPPDNLYKTISWCQENNIVQYFYNGNWSFIMEDFPFHDAFEKIHKNPTTGICVLNFAKNHAKSVLVVGFSFYMFPCHPFYHTTIPESGFNLYGNEQHFLKNWNPVVQHHNFLLELLCVKHMVDSGKVQVDSIMDKIIHLDLTSLKSKFLPEIAF